MAICRHEGNRINCNKLIFNFFVKNNFLKRQMRQNCSRLAACSKNSILYTVPRFLVRQMESMSRPANTGAAMKLPTPKNSISAQM